LSEPSDLVFSQLTTEFGSSAESVTTAMRPLLTVEAGWVDEVTPALIAAEC
jgi:hypothetical protein